MGKVAVQGWKPLIYWFVAKLESSFYFQNDKQVMTKSELYHQMDL